MHRFLSKVALGVALVLLAAAPAALQAQTPPRTLSLTHAMDLARRNNPTFLAGTNDLAVADWEVRSAYGAWLPQANVSGTLGWQGQGEQVLAGALTASQFGLANQPDYYSSSYRAGLSLALNGQTLFAPSQAKANREATEARIDENRVALEAQVTRLYLDVLRQEDALVLARQQLDRAVFNLQLAEAQAEVGTATLLDVRQAEVQVGRAEVGILQTENDRNIARVRFLQQLGLEPTSEVELITSFELEEPLFDEEALYQEALRSNPTLVSTRESVEAAAVGERIARSAYFPTLSLSAGISGFTREASNTEFLIAQGEASALRGLQNCQNTNDLYSRLANPLPLLDCSGFAFTEADRQALIEQNDVFPFNFTESPPSAGLSISIPVFQGLSRQRNLEAARAQTQDVRYQLRDQELALRAGLSANLAQVRTAYASARLEERNQALADEQLELAQERYQIGEAPFLDLVEAETVKAQADRDLVAAIYAYHDAITNLEAALGRPLRNR